MEEGKLHRCYCYFCDEWFAPEDVQEIVLEQNPSSSWNKVFSCNECLKTTAAERLTKQAEKALAAGTFNEITLTQDEITVRLVRVTPWPMLPSPIQTMDFTVPPKT